MNAAQNNGNGDASSDESSEKKREFDGPCQVCGRPGVVQAHPSAPVSVIRCEKHTDTKTFNPIYVVMAVFGVTAVVILIYLVRLILQRFS